MRGEFKQAKELGESILDQGSDSVSVLRQGGTIRIEVKEGIYARRVLYMDIRGQGAIPLTRTDENLTPREIEQKAAELAYFLRVPIEVF